MRHSLAMKKATMKLEAILAKNISDLMGKTPDLDTIDKVAIRSGVGRGTVDRVRKAEVSTKIETVELLAAAFGVSPLALLSEQGADENAVPARAPYSLQWLNSREEALLASYQGTDDAGRHTLDNIGSIVPKVSFADIDQGSDENAVPARAPYSLQWLNSREEALLTSYRSTDDAGRRTLDNIGTIVPKVSFGVLDNKAE